MSIYCEGSECSRKNNCALHNPGKGTHQYLDWSTYGSGRFIKDKDGNYQAVIQHSCGDKGNFKHFEPVDKNVVSIHDCSMTPQCYTASMRLPKVGADWSDECFTQECIEKIINNLKSTKGIHIISITNSETEDIVTFEVDSSIL